VPKKRKSGGRAKSGSGKKGLIQCSQCGKLTARDKAKKVTKYVTLIEPTIAKELRQTGTYIPRERVIKYYCVSCAVHRGVVKIRAREERK
jgi:small subunit ribosomal protein S26e